MFHPLAADAAPRWSCTVSARGGSANAPTRSSCPLAPCRCVLSTGAAARWIC